MSALTVVAILAGSARPAQGASLLLGHETQLAAWLGPNDLDFLLLFEKTAGKTSDDFHIAADGKGPTFTLLEAIYTNAAGQTATFVIGGYNPQSWSSIGNFNYTNDDAQRTAFIYNLTTGVKQDQRLADDPFDFSYGERQTYNYSLHGPTFGSNLDIVVGPLLVIGDAYQYSYGSGAPCGNGGTNILGAVTYTPPCFTSTGNSTNFEIGALEVYTFETAAVTPVPEPTSLVLLGAGLAGMVARLRARRGQRRLL